MPISRSQGYARGGGKEEGALVVAEGFFDKHVGVPLERITGDATENYLRGDFRAPSGASLECKGQPIGRFRQNFVEVCERTRGRNAAHAHGWSTLRSCLEVTDVELENVPVVDWGNGRAVSPFGRPPFISVSITSLKNAHYWIYVNPDPGKRCVFVYRAADLLGLIRAALLAVGMDLGRGNANRDTYSVMLANASWRWDGAEGQPWNFAAGGLASEQEAFDDLRETLLKQPPGQRR